MSAQTVPVFAPALDRINRLVYQRRGVLRQFAMASGWLEPGERDAVLSVATVAQDEPILDIGVGGGRTAPLMRQISADYHGIDYTPAMVALARQRFPDLSFEQMDARKLEFPDARFRLVTFSYNGIDSVDLAGREAILREVHRVLMPGGHFVFSAMNRNAVAQSTHWPDWTVFRGTGRDPRRVVRAMAKLAVGGINRLRRSTMTRDDGEVAMGAISAHNFGLVTVFTSPAMQVRQLREASFAVEAIFAPDGQQLMVDGGADGAAQWYHFVARKIPASPSRTE